jgi:hypothetical protein
LTSEGSHTLTFFAVDLAGNRSSASSSIAVAVDKSAPTLQNANVSAPANGTSYAEGEIITVTLTYSETIQVDVNNSSVTFDNGGQIATYQSHSSNTATYTYVVGEGESIESINSITTNVAISDLAGNAYIDETINL